ncbi:MAG: prepilin-type N-terminal cleavage/methylation domain-containing protein [Candidatus Saccharibacteria bacterium]|nr:prepilin-type N-terminal cleavage/methylation domain-containing protein [Candidatus Saccharibacteria bacterium]
MLKRNVKGFTLVELSIAIVFIGVLSVSVAVVIMNTVAAYHRGIMINQINTTGMDLIDEIRNSIQGAAIQSPTKSCGDYFGEGTVDYTKCVDDGGRKFVSVVKKAKVTIGGTTRDGVPIYGAFCTGKYSYIWNSGYFTGSNASFTDKTYKRWAQLKYRDDGGENTIGDDEPVRLLKIEDGKRAVCASAMLTYSGAKLGGSYNSAGEINNVFDISKGYSKISESPVDLIKTSGSSGLALFNFSVAQSDAPSSVFYAMSFILGTANGEANILANGKSCKPQSKDTGFTGVGQCAINWFNFSAETNGG